LAKKFVLPSAKPGEQVPFCTFLNIRGNMKPCTCDPASCALGFMVTISKDGRVADPVNQHLNYEAVVKETLANCPKLKVTQ